ncbi:hypothetical protein BBB39_11695 [Bordetella trematum]|uniref:Uncharacterized protein n=1 Tax=Bordetella trematum TaxID=123899 RepID=A0A157R3J5_9BORD|nr:hypothetical protein [Bordetella trematum]AZR94373.1 hypothetical protein BBB39_11695 [Bordetella trematum]NNH19914.1 hypothetical protein [Bordetella trematum]SAI52456.1 Uncharacterised protein [Bordetella trematum]SAI73307.1 Uncharacterised protein [Bordetella trematum]SUV97424.1 Uncharacterised protein [Bordetella trematum]
MLKKLPSIALFGSLTLSLANLIAAILGLAPALAWATGWNAPAIVAIPLAIAAYGWLIISWVNSLMSNRAGTVIYALNILLAPFGYAHAGLPYLLGLALALSPVPFYVGLKNASNRT